MTYWGVALPKILSDLLAIKNVPNPSMKRATNTKAKTIVTKTCHTLGV